MSADAEDVFSRLFQRSPIELRVSSIYKASRDHTRVRGDESTTNGGKVAADARYLDRDTTDALFPDTMFHDSPVGDPRRGGNVPDTGSAGNDLKNSLSRPGIHRGDVSTRLFYLSPDPPWFLELILKPVYIRSPFMFTELGVVCRVGVKVKSVETHGRKRMMAARVQTTDNEDVRDEKSNARSERQATCLFGMQARDRRRKREREREREIAILSAASAR